MTRHDYNSFWEFSESCNAGKYEDVTVIREHGWIKTDLMTECKSYKTAIRRFFKMLADIPEIADWEECLVESAENGYFKLNDSMMADGSKNTSPSYFYEIEETMEGVWYIFLNVRAD